MTYNRRKTDWPTLDDIIDPDAWKFTKASNPSALEDDRINELKVEAHKARLDAAYREQAQVNKQPWGTDFGLKNKAYDEELNAFFGYPTAYFPPACTLQEDTFNAIQESLIRKPKENEKMIEYIKAYKEIVNAAGITTSNKSPPSAGTYIINPCAAVSITEGAARTIKLQEAVKFDAGKLDWSLVPFDALEGMVQVLEFGAKKYARNNWQNNGGLSHTRVLNSLMRHLFAYAGGEDKDPETSLSHISHAMCNLMFLAHYIKHPSKFPKDDRAAKVGEYNDTEGLPTSRCDRNMPLKNKELDYMTDLKPDNQQDRYDCTQIKVDGHYIGRRFTKRVP